MGIGTSRSVVLFANGNARYIRPFKVEENRLNSIAEQPGTRTIKLRVFACDRVKDPPQLVILPVEDYPSQL